MFCIYDLHKTLLLHPSAFTMQTFATPRLNRASFVYLKVVSVPSFRYVPPVSVGCNIFPFSSWRNPTWYPSDDTWPAFWSIFISSKWATWDQLNFLPSDSNKFWLKKGFSLWSGGISHSLMDLVWRRSWVTQLYRALAHNFWFLLFVVLYLFWNTVDASNGMHYTQIFFQLQVSLAPFDVYLEALW